MKRRIENYLLRKLLCVIIPEDIFTVKGGLMFFGGEQIGDPEIRQLQAEIRALEGFKIYRVMTETTRNLSIRKSVHDATNWEQVLSGKLGLWVLSVFQDVINTIKSKR